MNAPVLSPAPGTLGLEKLNVDVARVISGCSDGFLDRLEDEIGFLSATEQPFVREAISRERLRRRIMAAPVKRTLNDALTDFGNAVHERGARAFRESRLPYPQDE